MANRFCRYFKGLRPSSHGLTPWGVNLFQAFESRARAHEGKTAIFWAEEEFSYQTLLDAATTLSARLQSEFGIQPGDRVALWMKNRPEFVPCALAILRAGGVVVPPAIVRTE